MKKFIVIYYAPEAFTEQMQKMNPEEMQKGMEPWMAWSARCGDGLVDIGTPLANGKKVTKSGTSSSDKEVVGYSILQADTIEKAIEMLKDHPHLTMSDSCSIEVYESMKM